MDVPPPPAGGGGGGDTVRQPALGRHRRSPVADRARVDGTDPTHPESAKVEIILAGTCLIVALASRGGLGAGDVSFGGLLGIAMGWQSWPVVIGGTLLAWTAAAASLLIFRCIGKDRLGHLPMGPYLLTGALLAITLR